MEKFLCRSNLKREKAKAQAGSSRESGSSVNFDRSQSAQTETNLDRQVRLEKRLLQDKIKKLQDAKFNVRGNEEEAYENHIRKLEDEIKDLEREPEFYFHRKSDKPVRIDVKHLN